MSNNVLAILISFAFVFIVLLLSLILYKFGKNEELTRKFVHILVGNWVFITPMFTNFWAAILVPVAFIIVNYLAERFKLIPSIERSGEDDNYGTVYYAISLTILTALSYIFKMPSLLFVGILTMAYADGFASLIGKKIGKRPLPFFPGKTVAGSTTVFVISTVITFATTAVLHYTGAQSFADSVNIWALILVAVLTGLVSVILEAAVGNGCDNLTLPIGSSILATLFLERFSLGIFVYFAVGILIVAVAMKKKAITLNGSIAAILTAMTLYGFGGLWVGIAILFFFVVGSLASMLTSPSKNKVKAIEGEFHARNWIQVLANSLPAVILTWIGLLQEHNWAILLAISVFAAATADTLSSEIGTLSDAKTYHPLTWKSMPRGLSGAVSWPGILAGLIGSALLSILALPEFGWFGFVISTVLGFLGTLLDSILGIFLQRKFIGLDGNLQDIPVEAHGSPVKGLSFVSNNTINMLTLLLISIIGSVVLRFTL